jgi:hypothetical protein
MFKRSLQLALVLGLWSVTSQAHAAGSQNPAVDIVWWVVNAFVFPLCSLWLLIQTVICASDLEKNGDKFKLVIVGWLVLFAAWPTAVYGLNKWASSSNQASGLRDVQRLR